MNQNLRKDNFVSPVRKQEEGIIEKSGSKLKNKVLKRTSQSFAKIKLYFIITKKGSRFFQNGTNFPCFHPCL